MAGSIGRPSGPIRPGQLDSLHIAAQHGEQLAAAAYEGPEGRRRFVSDVAAGYDEVRQGTGARLLLVKREEPTRVLFVELKPEKSGELWAVETAFLSRRE